MDPGERVAVLVYCQRRLVRYVGYAQSSWGAAPINSGAPTAAIQFAHDIGIRSQSSQANTIARWSDIDDRGGHFAALEEPELLIDDLRGFLHELKL